MAQARELQTFGCNKTLRVDEFFLPNDASEAKRFFAQLRDALLAGKRDEIIAMIDFPANFVLEGRGLKLKTPSEFVDNYDRFFTKYLIDSVRSQSPDELHGGWDGVSLSNGAVRFIRNESGELRINNIVSKPEAPPSGFAAEFLEHRLTCPPTVIEGHIVAYNWLSHAFPGFENIYNDHFIVDVTSVLRGSVPQQHIGVDFWGVSHLPEYNLPSAGF